MATSDTIIAVIALIVSAIALTVTTVQLVAQLFATAGGRHKCSTSVIGPWGKLTEVERHWREFRFEVYFVSPEIVLSGSAYKGQSPSPQASKDKELPIDEFIGIHDERLERKLFK